MVTSAKDNATYHFPELNATRIVTPIARKWIKVFKKRHDAEPDAVLETEGEVSDEEEV